MFFELSKNLVHAYKEFILADEENNRLWRLFQDAREAWEAQTGKTALLKFDYEKADADFQESVRRG